MPNSQSDRPRLPRFAVALLGAALLGGCEMERSFEGHTREEVWDAMVLAAQYPRYRDWVVQENNVWADPMKDRVEILRELKRDVVLPGQKPYREESEWRLHAMLEPGFPPTVKMATKDICVPAHFWLQADHYFDEVQARLAVAPPAVPPPVVPIDDPMMLPPSSIPVTAEVRDDPLDSVPGVAPEPPPPPPPAPAPPAPRPSGQSQPLDVP